MLDPGPTLVTPIVLAVLTLWLLAGALGGGRLPVPLNLRYVWGLCVLLTVADWASFRVAIWLFAGFAFLALREYFSLIDIRLQDRWGILGAYLSIGFMTYFIVIDWYGMFIISIPVYTFLVIPFLVAMGGGDARGTVFSVGAIDLGLFLFVYCLGHLGYLTFFSVRLALIFLATVTLCDLVQRHLWPNRGRTRYLASLAGSLVLVQSAAAWAGLPRLHALGLAAVLATLVQAGGVTMRAIGEDLGVDEDELAPGRGLVFDSLQSYLFTAPVAFHYLRWFLHWGDL